MKYLGMEGLKKQYKLLTETVDYLKTEIRKISELYLIGDPLGAVLCFSSKNENLIYQLDAQMKERKWEIALTSKPIGLRLTITLDNYQNIKNDLI